MTRQLEVGDTILIIGLLLFQLACRTNNIAHPEDVNALMASLAEQAVSKAKKDYNVTLDYSSTSIEQVETILGQLHEQHQAQSFSEARLTEEINIWGAYIGEVAKRIRAGRWQRDSAVSGKDTTPLVHDGQNESYPLAWVYKRITNGLEDNVRSKFELSYMREKFKVLDLEKMSKEAERK
jgi:hypothetical protein